MAFKRLAIGCMLGLLGCGGSDTAHSEPMVPGADDSGTPAAGGLAGDVPFGAALQTTTAVNLRAGPSSSEAIRLVMPSGARATAVKTSPTKGWYEINYQGKVGWSHGAYLAVKELPKDARDEAVARGYSVWGFSYHWGGGAWDPTSQSPGACMGSSCPACTHSGSWGADCSGFVAKAWMVPPSNTPLTAPAHPYGTSDFRNGTAYWSTLVRAQATRADALVYNSGSAGHIFLVVGGDPWNALQALECKSCVEGCVYNTRTASSAYVAIRRQGY